MAKLDHQLNARRIERLNKPGRYHDGKGLYLQVSPTGAKSWVYRYERDGRERMLGLGSLHDVELKAARDARDEARKQVRSGIDPIDAKEQRKPTGDTFESVAAAYYDFHSPKWKNLKAAKQFLSTMREYVFPIFGATPIAAIDQGLVLRVLRQHVKAALGHPAGIFWKVRPETASRVRGRIENVLDYAKVSERVRAKTLRDGPVI
jgi:hypothetical protein